MNNVTVLTREQVARRNVYLRPGKTPSAKSSLHPPHAEHCVQTIRPLPAIPRRLNVCAYCRVSSALYSQQSSISSQQAHFEALIKSMPAWNYVGIYEETGVSGTRAEIRPELQRLIEDCKAHKIDLILTKSISRFARNTTDCIELVRLLTSLNVNIWFESENIRTDSMDSEFLLSVMACFAEAESRSISGNVKWSIRKKFSAGTYKQALAPYGYRFVNRDLVIAPDEAAVVNRIYSSALSGIGSQAIASRLNQDGILSPDGKMWSQKTVRLILSNPVYTGSLLYQKTYVNDEFRQITNDGRLDQYFSPETHPPIISSEAFDKVQELVGHRKQKVSHPSSGHCFSGILICAVCESIMYRKSPVSWSCARHLKERTCPMKPQSEADLKSAFINCLNKLAWSQRHGKKILDVYERLNANPKETRDKLKMINNESRKLSAALLRDHFRPELIEKKLILRKQEAEIRENIWMNAEFHSLKAFINSWTISDSLSAFPENGFHALIESCTVHTGNSVTFHFRCGFHFTESLILAYDNKENKHA